MANTKVTALTADTSPTSDDLIPTVTDPAGTPASRKVTLANAITKAHGLSDGLVKVASGTMATATASTDYAPATSGTGILKGNGSGGFSTATANTDYFAPKAKLDATTAPGSSNDNTQGYAVGSVWVDTTNDKSYIAVDVTTGAAVWNDLTASAAAGISNVVEDTTPQLGGDLDMNTHNITAGATTISPTELGYLDGVTSAIQTQLNAKQASGATLTSLEGLTLGAGDLLYATAADTLTDLAIGTAGQVLTVNAGATAPEWATPAGGSAYVPKFRFLMGNGVSDTTTLGGNGVTSTNGTNSAFAYSSGGGVVLTPGSTTTGYSRYLWRDQITHEFSTNLSGQFWDRNMYGGCAISSSTLTTANVYTDFFFGFGDVQAGVSALTGAIKSAGLWIESRNGTVKFYISVNNGTTHTKTEITTAVNAISNPPLYSNLQYAQAWGLEWDAGTHFKIRCNGTTVGTVTTNLPSGSMLNDYVGGAMIDNTTSHSYNTPTIKVNHGFMEIDVW